MIRINNFHKYSEEEEENEKQRATWQILSEMWNGLKFLGRKKAGSVVKIE